MKNVSLIQVYRIAGSDRYDTAFQVYEQMKANGKLSAQSPVFFATGKTFPDALAASAAAAKTGGAVLLADNPKQAKQTAGHPVYAVGGQTANLLAAAGIQTVTAFAGKTRYETALQVASYAYPGTQASSMVMVATGRDFPDALAAGALSASSGALLVLSNPESDTLAIPAGTRQLMFVGGENTNPSPKRVN